MKGFLTTFFCLFCAVLATARTQNVPPRYLDFEWHRRIVFDPEREAVWGARLLDADSAEMARVEAHCHGLQGVDNTYGGTVTVTCLLGDSVLASGDIFGDSRLRDGFSIIISATGDSLCVDAGSRSADRLAKFVTPRRVGYIEPYAGRGKLALATPDRFSCHAAAPRDSVDVAALVERLRISDDPAESLWTHYDRDTDARYSRAGGQYILATCRAEDGTYKIVYLEGARDHADGWRPGHVKGVLYPTLIPGVYDLSWIQPDGTEITTDTGATLETDLLTLQFPRWKATYRFRRLPRP